MMRLLKTIMVAMIFGLLLPSVVSGQKATVNLIPKPETIEMGKGSFLLNKNTKIYCDKDSYKSSLLLADVLRKSTGYKIPVEEVSKIDKSQKGILIFLSKDYETLGKEGYVVDVSKDRVIVSSSYIGGVFNGTQTIRQLLPATIESDKIIKNEKWEIPCLSISDKPRFQWRGYMKDVSRTFYGVDVVKKYLDVMALYKLNTFHFHLTDDQGWRIEIKKYPKLTSPKATVFAEKHNQPAERSGFYTQEEIKDIIAYAADRNITIVPEVDVPGHCWPIILTYPELGVNNVREPDFLMPFLASWSYWGFQFTPNPLDPTKEEVYEFLDNVFGEVAELFPGEYIHFGGDEVVHRLWESEPHVKKFMQEKGLKDVGALQSYFVNRVCNSIIKRGKKPLGWNDILHGAESLTKETAIMSWLGEEAVKDAASKGFYTVVSPSSHLYFDITQADRNDGTMSDLAYGNINSLDRIYNYEPTKSLTPEEEKYLLGLQANQWSAVPQEVKDINVQNFPRLLALAEVAWLPKGNRNFDEFSQRLESHYPRLDVLKIDYYRKGGYITGIWTPDDVSTEFMPIEWDVTKKVYADGRITAGFFYTKGDSYLKIRKVQLLRDGRIISEDIHDGLADTFRGTSKLKTYLYNLKVDDYNPKSKYTLRAEVAGDKGKDSYGNFTFNLSPYKPFSFVEPK